MMTNDVGDITAIMTAYRRPHTLARQLEAIRRQTVRPRAVWIWANDPDTAVQNAIGALDVDRVVICRPNAFFHARFALALTAFTEYVALFDDDSIPGCRWFENCLETMGTHPGILGSAGVRLMGDGYQSRIVCGWHSPVAEVVEVDLVGQAWFLPTKLIPPLFAFPATTGTNGEDIELSARAWRLQTARTYCPPHPPEDKELWGSTQGGQLGDDPQAASRRAAHLEERDRIVRAEIAAGWRPLFLRGQVDRVSNVEVAAFAGTGLPIDEADTSSRPSQEDRTPIEIESRRRSASSGTISDWVTADAEIQGWSTTWRATLDARRAASTSRVLVVRDGQATFRDVAGLFNVPARANLMEIDISDGTESEQSQVGGAEPFDMVVCESLDRARDPAQLLRSLHGRLTADGTLIVAASNVRRTEVLRELLDGCWQRAAEDDGPLRYFTKRELEKLLYRAGFQMVEIRAVPGQAYTAWQNAGRPMAVQAQGLETTLPSVESAEELFAAGFIAVARRVPSRTDRLTSIVIVTHNQLAYTQICLDSIRMRTDEPYELVVVDNGSSDGTLDYLRSSKDVRLIANAENRGFPAGANQGIRNARGESILLLNNDTIVTTGWLRRMLDALHSNPQIGLAGPCSNHVSGWQQVPVSYSDLSCLDGFAFELGRKHDGQRVETTRLVGFCLLFRKEVAERIGFLDERFGIGNFEDDDFCRRALQAGYKAVIAVDAFVHHFGHVTFRGTGVDLPRLLEANERIYKEKWRTNGDSERDLPSALAVPAKTKPPAPQVLPAERAAARAIDRSSENGRLGPREKIRLSLCMIVRDNEATIGPCLESIRPWVDEIVVVDTGSKDRTPEVCLENGARLHEFPWCDDFSAARNESLTYARGEWIFWMDSDDTISAECGRKLRELAYGPHPENVLGYIMQVHCPGPQTDGPPDVTVVDHVKLIRNRADLRFEGRIHEQLLPAIRRIGGDVAWTDLFVTHSGSDHSPAGWERKLERDLRILHQELTEQPDHPFVLFNLGMTYADAKRYSEAVDFLDRCLAVSTPDESHLRKAYALLVNALSQSERHEQAWNHCERGLRLYPTDKELLFRSAMLHHHFGRHEEAERAYLRVLDEQAERHFSSVDVGLAGYKARHNLALVYEDMGRLDKAAETWRRIAVEVPNYRPAWRGLGEALLKQGKLDEVGALIDQLPHHLQVAGEAHLLESRLQEHAGNMLAAQRDLELAMEELPEDAEPLRRLCRLLFERTEPAAAEAPLLKLVAREPSDPSVHHNLGTVYLSQRRFEAAARCFRESLRLRPNSSATRGQLAAALAGIQGT